MRKRSRVSHFAAREVGYNMKETVTVSDSCRGLAILLKLWALYKIY